jgi:glycosyltransferase involved in cell wall biosynthesis
MNNTKSLKILVIAPTFLPYVGGAELGIHEIYKRIGQRHEVHILTPYLPKEILENLKNDYKNENYEVFRFKNYLSVTGPFLLKLVKQLLSLTSLFYIIAMIKHLRTFKPDVINFHYAIPGGAALIYAAKILKIPTILSLVGRPDVFRKETHFLKKLYLYPVVNSASYVLPITDYCLSVDGIKVKTKTIPYGVDTNEFRPDLPTQDLRAKLNISNEKKVLFTVQRLIRLKGVDKLINVMRMICERDANFVLVVGGTGPDSTYLKSLVKSVSLENNIIFAGYIPESELATYFAMCDIFVFHSSNETFGIVLVQAMSAAKPVVSVRTSAIPEVIADGKNGFLVSKEAISEFSDRVLMLSEDKEIYKKISDQNRREAIERYDWKKISDDYETSLLEARNS